MRASRLLSILLLCQHGEHWTASQLAARLEVSVRTIYRDVTELQSAGVPMWTESGPGGGIRLLEGWRSNLDTLTGDEAAALFLSGVPSAISALGLGAVALSAELKVRSALPPELATRASRLQERFHLDAPGWFHTDESLEHLPVIAEAVWASSRLDLRYARSGATDDTAATRRRTVDPLGLVLKAGIWYLVARHRGRVVTYRVSRVRAATVRTESFDRPQPFDLAQWWSASSAQFDRSLLRHRCRLALSPGARRLLPHVTEATAARHVLEGATPCDGDDGDAGWMEVWLETESEEVAAHQLLALGTGVEVREPQGLRSRLHLLGLAVAARHADGQTDSLNT